MRSVFAVDDVNQDSTFATGEAARPESKFYASPPGPGRLGVPRVVCLLPPVRVYPAHHISLGYNLAIGPLESIDFETVVAMQVSRLPKSGLPAWIAARPILIEMVSIENFPIQHSTLAPCSSGDWSRLNSCGIGARSLAGRIFKAMCPAVRS